MRDGLKPDDLPDNESILYEILLDAQFYCLKELEDMILKIINSSKKYFDITDKSSESVVNENLEAASYNIMSLKMQLQQHIEQQNRIQQYLSQVQSQLERQEKENMEKRISTSLHDIKFNIGGKEFSISVDVLCKYKESLLYRLFLESENQLKFGGDIFIDQDPGIAN